MHLAHSFDPLWLQTHLPDGVDGVMKFTRVWSGQLPSTGNKPKPKDVAHIRSDLSLQLEYLWQTHRAIQELKEYGYVVRPGSTNTIIDQSATSRQIAQRAPSHMMSLIDWITVDGHRYQPLVRSSLDLNCALSILFLRQDDPGALITQGGDLDGRMKTLLDALRMPSSAEQEAGGAPSSDTYCIMQSDTLVSGMEIETERLLVPTSSHPHEAQIVTEVSLRILRVHQGNYCLL